jgi:hypothetical protein
MIWKTPSWLVGWKYYSWHDSIQDGMSLHEVYFYYLYLIGRSKMNEGYLTWPRTDYVVSVSRKKKMQLTFNSISTFILGLVVGGARISEVNVLPVLGFFFGTGFFSLLFDLSLLISFFYNWYKIYTLIHSSYHFFNCSLLWFIVI